MSYREVAPTAELRPVVLSFWEFATATADFGAIDHEVFPDGCVSMFYHRNRHSGTAAIILTGLASASVTTTVYPGDVYWGMRFSPAACANVLRADPSVFATVRGLPGEFFPHLTEGLSAGLENCETLEEATAIYETRLKSLGCGPATADGLIAEALRIIEDRSADIRIAELAARLGRSPRQLERRFKKTAGLSPKQYVRARRIRATAVALVENDRQNWAARAAEMGFADQAHLTHEFVSMTKRPPNSFAAKVSRIKHGRLLK